MLKIVIFSLCVWFLSYSMRTNYIIENGNFDSNEDEQDYPLTAADVDPNSSSNNALNQFFGTQEVFNNKNMRQLILDYYGSKKWKVFRQYQAPVMGCSLFDGSCGYAPIGSLSLNEKSIDISLCDGSSILVDYKSELWKMIGIRAYSRVNCKIETPSRVKRTVSSQHNKWLSACVVNPKPTSKNAFALQHRITIMVNRAALLGEIWPESRPFVNDKMIITKVIKPKK